MDPKTSEWRPGPTVCRCCLTEGCYKDISTEYFWMGKREVYAEMLSDTFNVSISFSQSGGPNSNSRLICEPCISRLRDASDFKRQVQECEKTFMHHLDPGASSIVDDLVEPQETDVKLEQVKLEKRLSDDEFIDHTDFMDDDDDDLDDQPLTKLATRLPKKESVDLLDLLDNAKPAEKRKSSTKLKATSSKKAKLAKIVKKESVKAATSKVAQKTEKKKKEKKNDQNIVAKRNAEILVRFSTVYPFKLPDDNMVCVYCCESYADGAEFRRHMNEEHVHFSVRMAFVHCAEGYLKVDASDIKCRICSEHFINLEDVAQHLISKHYKPLDLNRPLGLQPFKIEKDRLFCAICSYRALCLRQLSRHTQTHFLRYTCEACGKSYATNTALRSHIRFSHIENARICRKCKKTFSSLEEKRKHISASPKCWSHVCCVCGQRFMTWHLKQQHLTHTHDVKQKTYVCPDCGEVFAQRKKFRVHFKLAHTNENYMCSCCGMKFETKKNLEEHRVTHTKEKLFPCTVCAKSFPRKKNLIQHMWIHMEHKRFECKPCNKKFNQKVSWKTHMKSYHPQFVGTDEGKNNELDSEKVYATQNKHDGMLKFLLHK